MSGGYFDYLQDEIEEVADDVQHLCGEDQYGSVDKLFFRECEHCLRRAAVYLHHVDLRVSDDTGEEEFARRLAEDLNKLGKK